MHFSDKFHFHTCRTLSQKISDADESVNPAKMFEMLFFALFGLNKAEDLVVSALVQVHLSQHFVLALEPWFPFTQGLGCACHESSLRLLPPFDRHRAHQPPDCHDERHLPEDPAAVGH